MVTAKTATVPERPLRLEPNTVPSFYDGAGRISGWREVKTLATDPEDWIASTSRRTGMGDRGLTVLESGQLLADALATDPIGWLGAAHVERYGATTRMLLKLLDAGQRLPVHVHPDRRFASTHLGQPNGKAEAWIVLYAGPGATVHLGFNRELTLPELARLVEAQDIQALLVAMNRLPVHAGDVLFCPPGVPHAIGADVLVIEIQEPSDSSIMLEWDGFAIHPDDRFLGLEQRDALSAVDRSAYSGTRLAELVGHRLAIQPEAVDEVKVLLPPGATGYFSADQLVPLDHIELDPGFSVLFVLEGEGRIQTNAIRDQPIHKGEVWLMPAAAGTATLSGDVSVVRCRAA